MILKACLLRNYSGKEAKKQTLFIVGFSIRPQFLMLPNKEKFKKCF